MASQRARPEPLRRNEIEAFAADWYHKLDDHVPAAEIAPLVLDRGLEFVVPEAILRSRRQFGGHPGVIVCSLIRRRKLSRRVNRSRTGGGDHQQTAFPCSRRRRST
jgi:hypothetical protein